MNYHAIWDEIKSYCDNTVPFADDQIVLIVISHLPLGNDQKVIETRVEAFNTLSVCLGGNSANSCSTSFKLEVINLIR